MSDTRLLLDGPELAPLIERARDIGGRVVRAERVRKGFGPFARNGYVVTVDVPGLDVAPSAPAARPATTPPRPTAMPELTAAGGEGPGGRAAARGGSGARTEPAPGLLGLEALLAVADGIDGPVLEDVGPRTGPSDATTADRATAPADPPPPPPSAQHQGPASVTGALTSDEAAPDRAAKRWSKPTWQRVERRPTTADAGAAGGAGDAPTGSAPVGGRTAAPATTAGSTRPSGRQGERPRRPGGRRPTPVTVDRAGPDALASLGVPASLVAPAAVDWTTALMTFAAHLPRPVEARLRSGNIVAVLGDPEPVRLTCAQMAARAGDLPVELVQVTARPAPAGAKRLPPGRRRVGTARSAGRLREERAGKLMLLTVETGGTETERETLREILRAFRPDQVWLALDARAGRAELEDRLTGLPVDHVDALAGQHAGRAQKPGELLDLGLPLAWLDGLPATGVVWAHALDEALRWANRADRRATAEDVQAVGSLEPPVARGEGRAGSAPADNPETAPVAADRDVAPVLDGPDQEPVVDGPGAQDGPVS